MSTMLARSSGEWIASDWPVCAISEAATPHRIGAALTYARRYALFTLVGIAGEDDTDAPDLNSPKPMAQNARPGKRVSSTGHAPDNELNSGERASVPARTAVKAARSVLNSEASAPLRDRLLAELTGLSSTDDAALWARRIMGSKNSLTAADAGVVEEAFANKLRDLEAQIAGEAESTASDRTPPPIRSPGRNGLATKAIDKSGLTFPEPRRIRDRDHVKAVAKLPCLICGRQPSDAHHLRFAQRRALGRKPSDEFTVPLCRGHHREVHRFGDEARWWKNAGIDAIIPARALWLETHPLSAEPPKLHVDTAEPAAGRQ